VKQHNSIAFSGIGIGDFRVFVEDLIHLLGFEKILKIKPLRN
jgi:purine-nucleoside phosphorylase